MGDVVVAFGRVDWMTGRAERDAWTDHGSVPDGDAAEVQEVAALVDEDPLAELDVEAVVAWLRCFLVDTGA